MSLKASEPPMTDALSPTPYPLGIPGEMPAPFIRSHFR